MPRWKFFEMHDATKHIVVRDASHADLGALLRIYNEGIEDRIATLELDPKSREEMGAWWNDHGSRYAVLVAEDGKDVVGWAALNPFSHRCAHAGIADLSIYVAREMRGRGLGSLLLPRLVERAKAAGFHKIVLHALNDNAVGKRLYRSTGFLEVGVFREHGKLGDTFVDVVAMERILK